jgi:hypothetical protein
VIHGILQPWRAYDCTHCTIKYCLDSLEASKSNGNIISFIENPNYSFHVIESGCETITPTQHVETTERLENVHPSLTLITAMSAREITLSDSRVYKSTVLFLPIHRAKNKS